MKSFFILFLFTILLLFFNSCGKSDTDKYIDKLKYMVEKYEKIANSENITDADREAYKIDKNELEQLKSILRSKTENKKDINGEIIVEGAAWGLKLAQIEAKIDPEKKYEKIKKEAEEFKEDMKKYSDELNKNIDELNKLTNQTEKSWLNAEINDPDGYTNIRSGKGRNFEILGIVREGEIFQVIKDNSSDWWQAKTSSGVTGYIHKSRVVLK